MHCRDNNGYEYVFRYEKKTKNYGHNFTITMRVKPCISAGSDIAKGMFVYLIAMLLEPLG